MSSRHADPALTVRPPAELTAKAKQLLGSRSRQMRGFITACLAALNANPDAFLAQLAEYWPAEKPRGRPPMHRRGGRRAVRAAGQLGR